MIIHSAEFVKSSTRLKDCPEPVLPEYAFVGRSNVGKSSLINMLTGRRNLAKTSATPGKTQLINHFIINGEWYLVDLPGMGYARAALSERKKWKSFISAFLLHRENLAETFLLVDARLKPQALDLELMQTLGQQRIPFSLVFTKTDKLTRNGLAGNLSHYRKQMLESWEELPIFFITSATTRLGRDEILDHITEVNGLFDRAATGKKQL